MVSADTLRRAAAVLRGRVDKLTTDTTRWDEAFLSGGVYADTSTYERLVVHPGVGLALADWLQLEADRLGWLENYATPQAVILARLILREEP